jgi:hypothetical protein
MAQSTSRSDVTSDQISGTSCVNPCPPANRSAFWTRFCAIIQPLVGILLLVAAFGKFATELQPDPNRIVTGWQLHVLLLGETLTGALLLTGVLPRVAALAGVVLFAAFAGATSFDVVRQARSCSCLGLFVVPPIVMLCVDACVLATMIVMLRRQLMCAGKALATVPSYGQLCLFAGLIALSSLCAARGLAPHDQRQALTLQGNPDLGVVSPAQHIQRVLVLRNDSAQPIEVLHVYASCGCTATRVAARKLDPGQKTTIAFTVATPATARQFRIPVDVGYALGKDTNIYWLAIPLRGTVKPS